MYQMMGRTEYGEQPEVCEPLDARCYLHDLAAEDLNCDAASENGIAEISKSPLIYEMLHR